MIVILPDGEIVPSTNGPKRKNDLPDFFVEVGGDDRWVVRFIIVDISGYPQHIDLTLSQAILFLFGPWTLQRAYQRIAACKSEE